MSLPTVTRPSDAGTAPGRLRESHSHRAWPVNPSKAPVARLPSDLLGRVRVASGGTSVANYYFNVHSIKVFERGSGSDTAVNVNDIDKSGKTLMSAVDSALQTTLGTVVDDETAKVRLEVDRVWADMLDEHDGINAWILSGHYGDPFAVRDPHGQVTHVATEDEDASRPTLLRFEANPARDEVLYASGRYGAHGVFARFTDIFQTALRAQVGDELTVSIDPVAQPEHLRALLKGAVSSHVQLLVPKAVDDPADYYAERRAPAKQSGKKKAKPNDEKATLTVETAYSLKLDRGHTFRKSKIASVLDSADERKSLARLVLGDPDANDEALTDAVLRIPVKLSSGKPKIITLPVMDTGIGGRLGFEVGSTPETDNNGYPTSDWLAAEAHAVLTDLRAPNG